MSKSLLSRSVWESLVSRITGKGRMSRSRRRTLRPDYNGAVAAESLETRIVPTVSATFNAGTLALVGDAVTNEVVTVKAGAAFTDVSVNGQFVARLNAATSNNITGITFNGGASAGDALSITGVNQGITVGLTDVEKLSLTSTRDTTVTSDEPLILGTSTVSGTLKVTPTGALTQSGKVIVSGTTTIVNTGNAITLTTAGNSFGTLELAGAAVSIVEAGATDLGISTITGGLTLTSRGAITDSGALSVSGGSTTLTSVGNSITLDVPTSTFSNNFVLSGTDIAVTDSSAAVLGKTTATGTLSVTSSGGTITEAGALKVGGLATFTTTNAAVTLNTTVNNYGSVSVSSGSGNVTLDERSATDLAGITTTGTLTVTSSGAITDSGVISAGATTLTSTGRAITLDEASTFGALTLSGSNVAISDSDATVLTTVTATGTFDLTSGGAISQTGNVSVIGRATFNATGNINLDTGASTINFGSLSLNGVDATIVEDSATDLFTSVLTGNLDVTATGHVTDSGDLTIGGTTTITASGTTRSITLDSAGSEFTGTVALSAAKNVAITNVLATQLAAVMATTGTFNLTSGGDVTQSAGVITATGGRTTIDATGYDITLNSANNFSSLALDGRNVAVTDANTLDLSTTNATGTLTVVTTAGGLTDSGTVNVVGNTSLTSTGQAITLDSSASTFGGTLAVIGSNVAVRDSDLNGVALATSTMSGTLAITAGGDITDSGTITAVGATFNAGTADITLDNVNNVLSGGSVSLIGTDATLTPTTGSTTIDLGTVTLAGDFILTTADAVSDSGTVSVIGTVTINATAANNIILNSAANTFGTLVLTGNAVTIVEAAATDLGATTAAGGLTVTSSGAITDSGTIVVTGATSLTATGSSITLDSATNTFSAGLTLTGSDITIVDSDTDTALTAVTATGAFTVSNTGAAGSITDAGTISVGGLATISKTNGAVILDSATNSFGSIGVTANDDSTIVEKNATNLAASTISGTTKNLSVTSGGAVTDSGNISVTGTTTIATPIGAGAITLDSTGNVLAGDLILTGSNVAVTNSTATVIGATTALGTLSVTSNGAVTQTGTVTSGGATTISAATFNITLASASNNFGSIAVVGANVSIVENSATDLAASTVSGTFGLTSGGQVTDSGTLAITGTVTISAAGFDITLDGSASTFGTLVLTGKNIAVTEDAAVDLGAITATGTLTIYAGGAVTDSGALDVTGQVTIDAGTFYGITLDFGSRTGTGFTVLTPLYVGNPVSIT